MDLQIRNLFPVTRLRPPGAQDTIKRETLIDSVRHSVLRHRLTLISAPAGAGKTTLAADFVRTSEDLTFRWLTLDQAENDIQPFMLAMLFAALPEAEEELLLSVSQGQMYPRQLATILINRFSEQPSPPIVIVLDDLHLVTDGEVFEFLDYLVDYLPPHVHFLVATRYDPPLALARLRARGGLAEVRLDALRFKHFEVDELLNRLLNLDIPAHLIDLLVQRTEGWVAGLRLLSLSLEKVNADKRRQYISDLAHQDRYVFDLLAEEVLAQQSASIQRFLLETSILSELTPESCESVTQQQDAANQLRELYRKNLFIISLGDGTYRYHALFRDFLYEKLKLDGLTRIKKLHYLAAKALVVPIQQLEHFIMAEAWDDAVHIVRDIAMENINSLLRTRLVHFVNLLPHHLLQTNPWLLLVQGSIDSQRGYFEASQISLHKAREVFREHNDIQGEILAVTQLARSQSEISDESFLEIYHWIREHGSEISPELQTFWLLAVMWNSVHNYRHDRIEQTLSELVNTVIQQDSINIYRTVSQSIGDPLLFTALGSEPLLRLIPPMQEYADRGDELTQMGASIIQGMVAVLQGDLDIARQMFTRSSAVIQKYGSIAWMNMVVDLMMLLILLLRDSFAEFDEYYQRAIHALQQDAGGGRYAEYLYLQGRRLMSEGQVHRIPAFIDQIEKHRVWREHEAMKLDLQARFARSAGDLQMAERHMQRACWIQKEARRFSLAYSPLSLALIHWQMNQPERALRSLQQALKQPNDWEYPGLLLFEGREAVPLFQYALESGIYVDLCRFCIDFWNNEDIPQPVPIPDSTESLTVREVEILREVVTGASNREIAQRLVISENTVKSHMTRILSKLGASSRTEATARVRELDLNL